MRVLPIISTRMDFYLWKSKYYDVMFLKLYTILHLFGKARFISPQLSYE